MRKDKKVSSATSRGQSSSKGSQKPPDLMHLEEIRELIDLIMEKGISDFELERSGVRIKISRNAGTRLAEAPLPETESSLPAATGRQNSPSRPSAPAAPGQASAGGSPPAAAPLENLYVVRSPMVGTFYSAPSPDAEPFVRVGDKVRAGQALCVIEAMKLMNEIEAEVAGEVIKCYIEDAQPVEYGEPLFDLRPL